ncbi:hypothetical protein [Mesobacterium pallidum]|uniref:hypothetical protein n=1 Tax=Mesobacterium pallidum TaxID=2872037 RepID=UPI001EE22470|nr:hypothetical protein [Mesobacterium pallidum]
MLRPLLTAIALSLTLASCAGEAVWAPDEAVERVRYRDPGPAKLTLFTMINNDTGNGGHSSLMINGSQRVIFDPAGSLSHPEIPERNDVIFGVNPMIEDLYTRYHARETWHVIIQEIEVSPEVAELALRKAMAAGPIAPAYCANSTSSILQDLPGFQSIPVTFSPVKLSQEFRKIAGVSEQVLHEYDSDDKETALRAWNPAEYKASQGR